MFTALTRAAGRLFARPAPSPNLMREFADVVGDPIVLPLLLELQLQAGGSPLALHLAAAVHTYLRSESAGGRQYALAEMLAAAGGVPFLIDGYHEDVEAREKSGPRTPLTPADRMLFRVYGGKPVPVLRSEYQGDTLSVAEVVEQVGWSAVDLIGLWRTAAGEQIDGGPAGRVVVGTRVVELRDCVEQFNGTVAEVRPECVFVDRDEAALPPGKPRRVSLRWDEFAVHPESPPGPANRSAGKGAVHA